MAAFENKAINTAITVTFSATGSVSFLFSLLLIVRLVRRRSVLLKKVKERLILGLCCMDIIFSMACIMSTFAGPTYLLEGPTREIFAHSLLKGSRATCNLQGWLYNMGVGAPLYNAALCCYYYLSICHRMQDSQIQKWIEPLMHTIIWAWVLTNSAIAAGLELVWFTGEFGCGISNPSETERCTLNPTLPDCRQSIYNANLLLLFLSFAPNIVAFLMIIVFIVLIYCKVRKTETRGRRWNFNNAIINRAEQSSEVPPTTALTTASSGEYSSLAWAHYDEIPTTAMTTASSGEYSTWTHHDEIPEGGKAENSCRSLPAHGNADTYDEKNTDDAFDQPDVTQNNKDETAPKIEPDAECSSRLLPAPDRGINVEDSVGNANMANTTVVINDVPDAIVNNDNGKNQTFLGRRWKRQRRTAKNSTLLSDAVTETGVQYALAYLITFMPIIAGTYLNSDGRSAAAFFVFALTLPSQGFWNWIIYTRGRLRVLRATRDRVPGTWCFTPQWWYAVFFE